MQSYEHNISGQVLMTEVTHVSSCDQFRKDVCCRTRLLVDDFYLCQANRVDCEHAFRFGMSSLCCSGERHKFSGF